MLTVHPHPLLDLRAFVTEFQRPLGEISGPALPDLLAEPQPVDASAVRDLLRHGGFKPAGRSKPASEYVRRAVAEGRLGGINLAVDACNAASFWSGLPISVIDLDRASPPLAVRLADPDTSYVFNASGQQIRVDGLVCLFDAIGPCANAVKDSQRTKTDAATVRTLSVIWGTTALPGRAAECSRWYRQVLEVAGAATAGLDAPPRDPPR